MQLNIFEHSHDIMLRNDVIDALEKYDASASRSAWHILSAEYPLDDALPALSLLIDVLEHRSSALFSDHDALRIAQEKLIGIATTAVHLFGRSESETWLKPLWRELAQRAAKLPLRPDDSALHAAPLWLYAEDWPAAIASISGIASWRRIPTSLAWMAEARYRKDGLATSWALLTELAWLSPSRFEQLTKQLKDPSLALLRKSFDINFEGNDTATDLAWFPAWVLTEKADLAPLLKEAQPTRHNAPERALQLLLELLALERQGRHHEMVAQRKVLQGLHPSLYAAYIKSR